MLSLRTMRLNSSKISLVFTWLSYGYVAVLVVSSVSHFFFWDTVQLASKHAHFFYNDNFESILLPEHLDSGHIPTFGWVLGLLWSVFGKSLWVGHLLMLPFGIGIVYQLRKLAQQFVAPPWTSVVCFLVLLDPTLSSQLTLVTPDIPLVFVFLWLVNSVVKNHRIGIMFGVALLFLISMRGMMIAFCLLLLDIMLNTSFKQPGKQIFMNLCKKSIAYFPAVIIFIAYFGYHYMEKGWVGFHESSPWAESFARVGWKGFLRNLGIFGWRLLDFGRIGIWIALLFLGIRFRKQLFQRDRKPLLLLALVLFCLLPLNMLWAKGLLGHRYLLPIYIMIALVGLFTLTSEAISKKLRVILLTGIGVLLITGNLWIYPPKVAQGWDATLAHRPYYSLRGEALNYMKTQQIPVTESGSFFPNTASFSAIDLTENEQRFHQFNGKQTYVFYTNVYNLSDQEWMWLETNYSEVKRFERAGVWVAIFKKTLP